jgi:hypothetical protein
MTAELVRATSRMPKQTQAALHREYVSQRFLRFGTAFLLWLVNGPVSLGTRSSF